MKISMLQVTQEVFLGDTHPTIASEEKDAPQDQRAVAIIRKANEGDNIKREELFSDHSIVMTDGGMAETVRDNIRRRWMNEAYIVLVGLRNVTGDDDKPVLEDVRAISPTSFTEIYQALPPEIAEAIHNAVATVNRHWM